MDSLFDIEVVPDKKDSEYEILKDNPHHREDKNFSESLWENFKPYADNEFKKKFACEFHQRFWEMYLANVLLTQNYQLIEKKETKSPDICIKDRKGKVWVEATVPGAGKGGLLLRYTSAIVAKHEKYLSYSGKMLISPDEPYIIAINGRQVPMAWPDDDSIPLIVKAVLPFGDPSYVYDLTTNKVVWEGYSHRPEIRTKNDSPVSTKIFLDPLYSGISGILFSLVNVWNRPLSLGSDFVFIHNPLAINKIPLGWLGIGHEYWMEGKKLEKRKLA